MKKALLKTRSSGGANSLLWLRPLGPHMLGPRANRRLSGERSQSQDKRIRRVRGVSAGSGVSARVAPSPGLEFHIGTP